MGHNKWIVACWGCVVASAIPGGLGMMLGVVLCAVCAGGCFMKWVVEEEKQRKAEYEKQLNKIRKKGLTNNP